jgi:amidase
VAVSAANPLEAPVDPECVRAMQEAAELLATLGHDVEEATPALPGPSTLELFISAFGPAIALQISYGERLAHRPAAGDEIEPLSRAVADLAHGIDSVGYLAAVAQLQALARGLVAFFARYDVLLTPALAERPLRVGECNGLGEDPLEDLARSGRFTPYTALFNVTGQPAIALPMGLGPDGLPSAVQLVAKPLGEDTLLQVAQQIETARGGPAAAPPPPP